MSDTSSNPSSQRERISIRAPKKTKAEEVLEEKFYQDLAEQPDRLDKFALELIKLQLAIPALYAGILKFKEPEKSLAKAEKALTEIQDTHQLIYIFVPWLLALALSFWSILVFPMERFEVKSSPIIEPLPDKPKGNIAVNAYFHFAAKRKFWRLVASSLFTFLGIIIALINSF